MLSMINVPPHLLQASSLADIRYVEPTLAGFCSGEPQLSRTGGSVCFQPRVTTQTVVWRGTRGVTLVRAATPRLHLQSHNAYAGVAPLKSPVVVETRVGRGEAHAQASKNIDTPQSHIRYGVIAPGDSTSNLIYTDYS